MKQTLLAIAFLLGCGNFMIAQTCSFSTSATAGQFCGTCNTGLSTTDIVTNQNVLSGTLSVENNINGNASGSAATVNVPATCTGPVTESNPAFAIGALTINLGQREIVNFDILVSEVTADAANFNITGAVNGNNAGQVRFRGTTYGRGQVNSLSDLVLIITNEGKALQALPVNLIYWTTKITSGSPVLVWATATELDNDYFLLERSTDGIIFTELTRVAGKGTSDSVIEYDYTDAAPAAGMNYYRLSQIDFDGTRTTFDVRSVEVGEVNKSTAFPNPARAGDRVTFQAPARATEVLLHSITGREVGRYPVTGGIDLPATLPAGVYLLRAGEVTTRLLVRQ